MTLPRPLAQRRAVAWVALLATLVWGALAYRATPQRHDPVFPRHTAVVTAAYPGASADKVELDATRAIERSLRASPSVLRVSSVSTEGLSTVFVELRPNVSDVQAAWGELRARLAALDDLPRVDDRPIRPELDAGAGLPAQVVLAVSGPTTSEMEVQLRAESIRSALDAARNAVAPDLRSHRASAVIVYPETAARGVAVRQARTLLRLISEAGIARDGRVIEAPTTACADFQLTGTPAQLDAVAKRWRELIATPGNAHPDLWPPVILLDTAEMGDRLRAVALDKYSYRRLAEYADTLADHLRREPAIAGVEVVGAQREVVTLLCPGNRLSQHGLSPHEVVRRVQARNANLPSGRLDLPGQTVVAPPTGEFRSEQDIANAVMAVSSEGHPLYLRDLADISRGYADPPDVMVFRSTRPPAVRSGAATQPHMNETYTSTRAIALAIRRAPRSSAEDFDRQVRSATDAARLALPEDLRVERVIDEPREIDALAANLGRGVIEAIAVVTLIVLLTTPWREAIVVSLSIPLTLALTAGVCHALGIDLQQMSMMGAILATGLAVRDPLLAAAAARERIASPGPAGTICTGAFVTALAFAPVLLISGDAAAYVSSLAVVAIVASFASALVAMTFVPLLCSYLIAANGAARRDTENPRRTIGEAIRKATLSVLSALLAARGVVALIALITVALAAWRLTAPPTAYFESERQGVFVIDVELDDNATARQTRDRAAAVIREVEGLERARIESFTTFVGSDGPAFRRSPGSSWSGVPGLPGAKSPSRARILAHAKAGEDTDAMISRLRSSLPPQLADVRVSISPLSAGPAIGAPVELRLFGPDETVLRQLSTRTQDLLRRIPGADNVRDDWGRPVMRTAMTIDMDRVPAGGVTPQDIGSLLSASLSGLPVTKLREGGRLIDVVMRLPPEDRGRIEDLSSLTVYGAGGKARVPLRQFVRFEPGLTTPRIVRRGDERCVTLSCEAASPMPPAKIAEALRATMDSIEPPAGYRWELAGEAGPRTKTFASARVALLACLAASYLVMLVRLNHAGAPLAMFAGAPLALAAALVLLQSLGDPFDVAVLLGVIPLSSLAASYALIAFDGSRLRAASGALPHAAAIGSVAARARTLATAGLAAAGAAMPLALRGGQAWATMSWVWMAGVLTAAAAAIVLTPVVSVILAEDLPRLVWGKHPRA